MSDFEVIKIINDVVNELCPNKRKPKYANEYYIKNMLLVLKDVVSWRSLKIINKDASKYHFKTINDKFLLWSRLGIFKEAHKRLLQKYTLNNINYDIPLDLFLDSTSIDNKNGSELINFGKNKKKRISKISVIANKYKETLSVTFFKGNINDAMTIDGSVKDLNNNINHKNINLIADKGYPLVRFPFGQSSKGYIKDKNYRDNLLRTNKVNLIFPHRKNMKIKTSVEHKLKLKNRYTIENTIQQLKKFNRIALRRDKLICTYSSFVYLGLCLNMEKISYKKIKFKED
jgi:transposase